MHCCKICKLFDYDDGYYSTKLSDVLDHIVEIHSLSEIIISINVDNFVGVE